MSILWYKKKPNQNNHLKKRHFTFQLELPIKLENIKIREESLTIN